MRFAVVCVWMSAMVGYVNIIYQAAVAPDIKLKPFFFVLAIASTFLVIRLGIPTIIENCVELYRQLK